MGLLQSACRFESLIAAAVPFKDITPKSVAALSDSMIVGVADYDNDGLLDLVFAGSETMLFRNLGGNQFQQVSSHFMETRSGGVAWGDYDNDGYMDLVTWGMGLANATHVYHNEHGTNFTLAAVLPVIQSGRVAWGDFDGDGDLDLGVTGSPLALYENVGGGRFELANLNLMRLYAGDLDFGDYDNDGDLDMVVTGYPESGLGGTYVFHNNRNGGFDPPQKVHEVGDTTASWIDVDNDGTLELIEGVWPYQFTMLLTNNAATGWGQPQILGPVTRELSVGDLDNDGLSDAIGFGDHVDRATELIVPGAALFQNKPGGWSVVPDYPIRVVAGISELADLDRDGDLDLVLASPDHSRLFRNDISVSNTPPSRPAGLRFLQRADSAVLVWERAGDVDQASGLTYNVRVGTVPGGEDVVSPMAFASGLRKIARRGNVGARTEFTLRRLKPGIPYYWSVQAIDNAFAGSSFAEEATFQLGAPVAVKGLNDLHLPEDFATRDIPFQIVDVETPPDQVAVRVSSDNPRLVPSSNLGLTGQGGERVLTLASAPDQFGTARITLTFVDQDYGENSVSFLLTVDPVNDAPVAIAQSLTTLEDRPVAIQLAATDVEKDPLRYVITTLPAHGVLSGVAPTLVYTPSLNYFGKDEFAFTVRDGGLSSVPATVSVSIGPVQDVKKPSWGLVMDARGVLTATWQAEPFQTYLVESSEDLIHWTRIAPQSSPSGRIQFSLDTTRPPSHRFLRATPQP